MDQYLNNRQNEILWKLLANPADDGHMYGSNLEQLVEDFPQSGLFRALLARASKGESVQHAAASFNTRALYVMMNAYENLAEVSEGQVIQKFNTITPYTEEPQVNTPVIDSEGNIDPKVVIGEDERHEVDTLEFEHEPEQIIEEEPETGPQPLVELPQEEVEVAPESILEAEQPAEDEKVHTHASVFEEEVIGHTQEHPQPVDIYEPAIEMPGDDHRAEMHAVPFEEELLKHAEEHPQAVEIYESATEIPGEDRRAEMHTTPFEEEVIEPTHTEAAEEFTLQPDERITEVSAEDHRAELFTPIFEEEIIEWPGEEQSIEEAAVIESPASTPSKDIEDEVYDEIVGIENISYTHTKPPVEEVVQSEIEGVSIDEEEYEDIPGSTHANEVEESAVESNEVAEIETNVADTSYFVFEKEERNAVSGEANSNESITAQTATDAETQNVSKYHDDKMPYTFMWWLDKTRREHAGIYQPFKLDTTQAIRHNADETLQQQYYENIFHVTTIEELNSAADQVIAFDMKNKEDRIIKKFIVEEPHISTPSGDKLDNENKAKRSAEDQDGMVTETLARIYVDQMLYHKAINTYKKLILKFPEKSRYFADQIELLERKIN